MKSFSRFLVFYSVLSSTVILALVGQNLKLKRILKEFQQPVQEVDYQTVFAIDITNAPTIGQKDAPVKIVVFSDFDCPVCADAAKTLAQIQKKNPDKISVSFKNFPLSQHEMSFDLSSAAMAAHAQGHFWKMHDLLFSNVAHDKKEILILAEKAGMDSNSFLTDWQSDFIRDQVLVDLEEGQQLNLVGTPSIFLNGIKSPTANKDDLLKIINRLLKSI